MGRETVTFSTQSEYGGSYVAVGGHIPGALEGTASPAFYYGSDSDCDLKVWSLLDVQSNGATGSIQVTFGTGPGSCYLPGWQGQLTGVEMSADRSRLRFGFSTSDGYGPILYELVRTCESAPPAIEADAGSSRGDADGGGEGADAAR